MSKRNKHKRTFYFKTAIIPGCSAKISCFLIILVLTWFDFFAKHGESDFPDWLRCILGGAYSVSLDKATSALPSVAVILYTHRLKNLDRKLISRQLNSLNLTELETFATISCQQPSGMLLSVKTALYFIGLKFI